MTTPELKPENEQPFLWIPGWAVRVYVEIELTEGVDALQKAILGLIQAGVPGVAGSLANELCLEETIVESVLKSLYAFRRIRWEEDEWKRTTEIEDAEGQVMRRVGWVFWDSLRHRLLPELLMEDNGIDHQASAENTPNEDVLKPDDFQKPKSGQVRSELIPTFEAKGFVVRVLRRVGSRTFFEEGSGRIVRVSILRSSLKVKWHPLVVPYRIETNLGANPSIYCGEPVYSPQLSADSPYSPFLRATIEDRIANAYRPIKRFADELQSKERNKHGAGFLAPMGSPERLDSEARNAVLRMLGGKLPEGPFAAPALYSAAEDAERIWLTMAELPQSSESLRNQYSRLLQVLAICLSDEMLPLWQNNQSARRAAQKFPSRWEAGKRGLNYDDGEKLWDVELRRFSKMHGIPFDTLGIKAAGEMMSSATYEFGRTQLGVVFRSWAAFAVAAQSDPDGSFVLAWISESLAEFPSLFSVFKRFTDQRNLDKGRSIDNVSIGEYRDGIYTIWKAVAEGYNRAVNQSKS